MFWFHYFLNFVYSLKIISEEVFEGNKLIISLDSNYSLCDYQLNINKISTVNKIKQKESLIIDANHSKILFSPNYCIEVSKFLLSYFNKYKDIKKLTSVFLQYSKFNLYDLIKLLKIEEVDLDENDDKINFLLFKKLIKISKSNIYVFNLNYIKEFEKDYQYYYLLLKFYDINNYTEFDNVKNNFIIVMTKLYNMNSELYFTNEELKSYGDSEKDSVVDFPYILVLSLVIISVIFFILSKLFKNY